MRGQLTEWISVYGCGSWMYFMRSTMLFTENMSTGY